MIKKIYLLREKGNVRVLSLKEFKAFNKEKNIIYDIFDANEKTDIHMVDMDQTSVAPMVKFLMEGGKSGLWWLIYLIIAVFWLVTIFIGVLVYNNMSGGQSNSEIAKNENLWLSERINRIQWWSTNDEVIEEPIVEEVIQEPILEENIEVEDDFEYLYNQCQNQIQWKDYTQRAMQYDIDILEKRIWVCESELSKKPEVIIPEVEVRECSVEEEAKKFEIYLWDAIKKRCEESEGKFRENCEKLYFNYIKNNRS